MKIVVIGGHLSPALAVLNELKDQEVLYLGRKYTFEGSRTESLEYGVINSLGLKFKNITTGRLQRNFSVQTVFSLLKLPVGFVQSLLILKNFKPDVVLGFGGYVQIPVVLAGFILRIPIVIHEQSLGGGIANRMSSFFAKKILISWEPSTQFFPKRKTVLTGLPLRAEIFNTKPVEKSEDLLVFVTGGTSGSHTINSLMERSFAELLKRAKIFHQTGDSKEHNDFEKLSLLRDHLPSDLKKKYMIMKFVDSKDASEILQSADLIISRAGINTISEIIYFGKPSLLIPLTIGSEQKTNALFLKSLGLAEVLYEESLTAFQFLNAAEMMLKNLNHYKKNPNPALIKKDAARKIAAEVLNAGRKV